MPFLIFIQFANPGNILFLWIWLRVFQKRLDNFFGLDHNQSILLTHLTPRDLWPAVMVSSLLFMIMTEIFHMSFGIVNDMANLIGFNLTPGIGPHEMAQIRALENLSQNHMRPSDLLEVVWSYLALILLPRVISVGSSIAVYMAVEAYVAARVLNDCSMANVVYRFVIGWARIVIPLSFAVQFGVGLLASIWGSMHISSLVISLCAGIPYCLVGFHQWNRNLRKLRSGSPMEALRGN
ncbi:hypothetical protein HYR69_05705 [Candidatus Sumerlaeota bacterium]|nr:hypothetical protein [Candidatus Sumerlaeota bacterium]